MKTIANGLKVAERQMGRMINSVIGIVTSVASGGKSCHTQNYIDAELRELRIALPYGISSSAIDGMQVQVIFNQGNNTVVGVIDPTRPNVDNGETIIYSKFGSLIKLDKQGNIEIIVGAGKSVDITGDLNVSGKINGA